MGRRAACRRQRYALEIKPNTSHIFVHSEADAAQILSVVTFPLESSQSKMARDT